MLIEAPRRSFGTRIPDRTATHSFYIEKEAVAAITVIPPERNAPWDCRAYYARNLVGMASRCSRFRAVSLIRSFRLAILHMTGNLHVSTITA